MDTADPLILEAPPRNPVARAARAVSDKVHRVEDNVLNLPLTSVALSALLGAGVVALAVLVGRALEHRIVIEPGALE